MAAVERWPEVRQAGEVKKTEEVVAAPIAGASATWANESKIAAEGEVPLPQRSRPPFTPQFSS